MKKATALVLTLIMVVSLLAATAIFGSAEDFSAIGTLNSSTPSTITNGLTLTNYDFTDKNNAKQIAYALQFDPAESDLMPLMFNHNNGWGITTLNTGKKAEELLEYDVVAGVNADFFDMATGVALHLYISNGRIATDSVGSSSKQLAFDRDGKATVVTSNLQYKMYLNNNEWTIGSGKNVPLAHINKRSNSTESSAWSDKFYYWDFGCGTKTDSKIDGTEIVVKKLDNTDLTVGGILKGEVVEVRTNSKNSAFERDQFVLYVKNGSSLNDQAKEIKVGDKIDIVVSETNPSSRSVMENAITTIPVPIQLVANGQNFVGKTGFNALGLSLTESAQRTMIGIKADGSLVVAICDGRNVKGNDAKGFTLAQAADYMIGMGCVEAFNLDGGGSTQMIKENASKELEYVFSSTRGVTNSLLIVRRKDSSAEIKNQLQTLVTQVEEMYPQTMPISEYGTYELATKLLAATKTMPGEFPAMISRMYRLLNKPTKAYINIAKGKPYSGSRPWDGNYADPNKTELTDGVYAALNYGPEWVGWNANRDLVNGKHYVIIDLGKVESDIEGFLIHFKSDLGAGIGMPSKVEILYSAENTANPTQFTSVVTDTTLKNDGNVIELINFRPLLQNKISARHIKIEFTLVSTFTFVSEIEVLKAEGTVQMSEPETSEPETSEPETSEPETSEPETSEPETSEPATSEPATSVPVTSAPQTSEESTPGTGDKTGIAAFIVAAMFVVTLGTFAYRKRRTDR